MNSNKKRRAVAASFSPISPPSRAIEGSDEFYKKEAGFAPSRTDSMHLILPIQDIAEAFK